MKEESDEEKLKKAQYEFYQTRNVLAEIVLYGCLAIVGLLMVVCSVVAYRAL